ncbi:ATP-binding cassette domain-containing protein [Arthrobacter sp. 31Y]|uniref:ATP-binding cassette domain-containing protein n=1 Tax=Arthrobacter sp. 31Y TaxID=1115632 RepID=UPI000463B968|nr:ABC transporter ATP-binding protein [Arthrobacter sp. 31Y]
MRTTDILVNALGGLVRVRFDYSDHGYDPDLFSKLTSPWSDAVVPRSGVGISGEESAIEVLWPFPDSSGLPGSVAELSTHTTLAAIEAQRGRLLMLHAAGVSNHAGQVLVLIGPSGRGKTTLAQTLGGGLGYVTDETVGIDANGAIHPYRKPLSVIRAGEAYKEQIAPSALGLRKLPEGPLHLGALVLVSRTENHTGKPQISAVGLCAALAALVPEVSYLSEMDQPLQTLARHVDRCGAIKEVIYGEASDLVPLVEALFNREEPEAWEAVLPQESGSGTECSLSGARYVPAPVLDAVEAAGQTAILDASRMVTVIDGVAPLVWRGLCYGLDFSALAAQVEARFGAPPHQELDHAVLGVLEALAAAGLALRVGAPQV